MCNVKSTCKEHIKYTGTKSHLCKQNLGCMFIVNSIKNNNNYTVTADKTHLKVTAYLHMFI